jgi:hypothetical protein
LHPLLGPISGQNNQMADISDADYNQPQKLIFHLLHFFSIVDCGLAAQIDHFIQNAPNVHGPSKHLNGDFVPNNGQISPKKNTPKGLDSELLNYLLD